MDHLLYFILEGASAFFPVFFQPDQQFMQKPGGRSFHSPYPYAACPFLSHTKNKRHGRHCKCQEPLYISRCPSRPGYQYRQPGLKPCLISPKIFGAGILKTQRPRAVCLRLNVCPVYVNTERKKKLTNPIISAADTVFIFCRIFLSSFVNINLNPC